MAAFELELLVRSRDEGPLVLELRVRGGLVPGIGDYAYLVPPVVAALGSEWALHGWMKAKLLKPVYDGDEVEAKAAWAGDEHEELVLELYGEDGVLCAQGAASAKK